MVFLRNKPLAADLLSDSQPIIEDNFNTLDSVFGNDHYQFSDTTANIGLHKIIHQTTLNPVGQNRTISGVGAVTANFPANIPGLEQTFAALYTPDSTGATADTQLFALTGNGGLSQLTGNLATSDGWVWVGGILMQWGISPNANLNGSITFKDRVPGAIPFPNNCWVVVITNLYTNSPSGLSTSIGVRQSTLSKNGFDWRSQTLGNLGYLGFNWIAIGN